jgi:HK97 gp10 family phage protein
MIQIVNRTGKFMSTLTANQKATLEEIGKFCKSKMDEYAAVDTGYMRSRNTYVIASNELYLQNDAPYAIYQEKGTYKMKAHPFMNPAVYNHLGEIKQIAESGLTKGL